MDSANTAGDLIEEAVPMPVEPENGRRELSGPAALLRGTQRGLEMIVNGRATIATIAMELSHKLAEAPNFFRGSDVRVAVEDGPLPAGCVGKLDQIANRFGLRIVEVGPAQPPSKPALAAGSAPPVEVAPEAEPAPPPVVETMPEPPPMPPGTRLFVGPVRSGVILDHTGHLIVFGDVNPGAEVRATGNIVVLGRLKGTAHAGIGQDTGFIIALRLEPQQLRIGRMVARAADSDTPPTDSEIAYATNEQIVVERYTGKLPRNLATSL